MMVPGKKVTLQFHSFSSRFPNIKESVHPSLFPFHLFSSLSKYKHINSQSGIIIIFVDLILRSGYPWQVGSIIIIFFIIINVGVRVSLHVP